MRQLKTLNEEVEWISKRIRGGRARAEILGWLLMRAYSIPGVNLMLEDFTINDERVYTD